VRDIAGLYIYENTLVVLEITGQQLKDALEHSAKFFRPFEAGKTPAELVDTKIPGYNFDVAEGVTYEIDISKPVGQRIVDLRFKGQPLVLTQKLRLATNNYRAGGGGGYEMFKNAPVLDKSSREIRELIIDWVERNHSVPTEASNNWRIVGLGAGGREPGARSRGLGRRIDHNVSTRTPLSTDRPPIPRASVRLYTCPGLDDSP
jgi:2',3'-cyclic-nucleotide 2'-phosphodiesterase/3'-nucleotidase